MNSDNWLKRLQALRESMPGQDNEPDLPQHADEPKPAKLPRLDIILDRKGRAGKTATIICGFLCDDSELTDIAGHLKRALGTGGSTRGGEILIQGDRRNDCARFFQSLGYKTRCI